MFGVNLSFLRIGWLRVALRERLRACRVRYGVDGMIMEFKISV